MSHSWWLSCTQFTVSVKTDDNLIITESAPIVSKFKGQPLKNLTDWMKKISKGLFKQEELKND